MRVLIWILVMIPIFSLSITLNLGRECVYSGGDLPNFSVLEKVLTLISDYLGYTPPTRDSVADSEYLEFRGKILGVSKSTGNYTLGEKTVEPEFMSLKRILEYFDIPILEKKGTLIVPECVLRDIRVDPNSAKIYYSGNPAFVYKTSGTSLKIVSTGFVLYGEKIYEPGETIVEIPSYGMKVAKILEHLGNDLIFMEKLESTEKLILEDFGSWGGKPIPTRTMLILFGRGSGLVVIRPFSRDLKGIDLEAFRSSEKLARRVANILGYSFEICPLADLPIGSKSMAIFLKKGDEFKEILEILREMIDFEILDNRVDAFGPGGVGD